MIPYRLSLQQENEHENIHRCIQQNGDHHAQYQHHRSKVPVLQGRIIPQYPGQYKTNVADKGHAAKK